MPAIWPLLYRGVTAAVSPLIGHYLKVRARRGKEDPERLGERFGIASAARPGGPLVWIHAASVGEANSVLALIDRVRAERPAIAVLMTTGTVAAARLLQDRLPRGARHQFVPVDTPRAVERFLDHWRPGLAIWVESELWPNLVLATHRRGIPMLLANARLSAGSLARWRAMPWLVRPVLQGFSLCLAQDEVQAERFRLARRRAGRQRRRSEGGGSAARCRPGGAGRAAPGNRGAAGVAGGQHPSRRGGDRRGCACPDRGGTSRPADGSGTAPSGARSPACRDADGAGAAGCAARRGGADRRCGGCLPCRYARRTRAVLPRCRHRADRRLPGPQGRT